MRTHPPKFQPRAIFGKLAAALIFLLLPGNAPAQETAGGNLAGRATIQLKNASYRSDLAGMDLVLAPTNLIPELRKLRMETWRTEGLAVSRSAEGEEKPVGVRVDFSDGYKNLDLAALSQAAANAATYRTKTATNGAFNFSSVSPGNYALYGQYRSRYAVAYWLLEAQISRGQTQRVDLTETNAAEVFNRFEKPAR